MSFWFAAPQTPPKLFIELPRTGTRWSRAVISRLCAAASLTFQFIVPDHALPDHKSARALWSTFGPENTATIIRSPHSWYESIYKYWIRDNGARKFEEGEYHPYRPIESMFPPGCNPTFSEWLTRILDSEPAFLTKLAEQAIGPWGAPRCGRVLNTISLFEDMYILLTDWGFPIEAVQKVIELDKVNATKGEVEWDDGLSARVSELEIGLVRRCL